MRKSIMPFLMAAFIAIVIFAVGMEGSKETSEKEHNEVMKAAISENMTARSLEVGNLEQSPKYTKLYPDLYAEKSKIPKSCLEKIAYLTFDDGPSKNTEEVLDLLEKNNIKATFFIIGNTITDDGKKQLKRMVDEGNAIGIHTFSHEYKKIYSSVENYLKDFYNDYKKINEITGVSPTIFRFPGGSVNAFNKNTRNEIMKEMERRGFTYYDWNVSAEDAVGKPTIRSIVRNVNNNFANLSNPVILMHDGSSNSKSVKALPEIINTIKNKGYKFDVLTNRPPCQFDGK